jgi:hypothetical protein
LTSCLPDADAQYFRQIGFSLQDFYYAALKQRFHAFGRRYLTNSSYGLTADNHMLYIIGGYQQFKQSHPAVIAHIITFRAAFSPVKNKIVIVSDIEQGESFSTVMMGKVPHIPEVMDGKPPCMYRTDSAQAFGQVHRAMNRRKQRDQFPYREV